MLCGKVFDRFVSKSPVTVLLRGVLERALAADFLNRLFDDEAEQQYTRELQFSNTVDLMAAVACRMYPSVHAAYQDKRETIRVSMCEHSDCEHAIACSSISACRPTNLVECV